MSTLLTTALLFACAEEAAPPAEPWLELGTGVTEFVPLEEGAELELVYGPQGGWHVDTTARFGGVALEGASLTYYATDPGDGALLNYVYEAQLSASLVNEIEGGWLRLGDRVVFDVGSDDEILGREALIEATLVGGDGALLSDAWSIVVVEP